MKSTQTELIGVDEIANAHIEKDKIVNALSTERNEIQELKETINQIRQSVAEIQDSQDRESSSSRWEEENQGYNQSYDERPWRQDGYRQFESRAAYSPWYTFGGNTRPFKSRGDKQNSYRSNRYAFSNHF